MLLHTHALGAHLFPYFFPYCLFLTSFLTYFLLNRGDSNVTYLGGVAPGAEVTLGQGIRAGQVRGPQQELVFSGFRVFGVPGLGFLVQGLGFRVKI